MGDYADDAIEQGMHYSGAFSRKRCQHRIQLSAPRGSDLARLRCMAHAAFDPKWQSGKMSRTEAYAWLAKELSIPKEACHMLMFDEEMCKRVLAVCTVDDFDVVES